MCASISPAKSIYRSVKTGDLHQQLSSNLNRKPFLCLSSVILLPLRFAVSGSSHFPQTSRFWFLLFAYPVLIFLLLPSAYSVPPCFKGFCLHFGFSITGSPDHGDHPISR